MKYESPRKIFRDKHKNPDMYPIDPEESAIISKELEADKAKNGNKDVHEFWKSPETITQDGKLFKEAVDLIQGACLKDNVEDKQEEIILEQRKKITIKYLVNILEDIKNYLTQVNATQMQRVANYDDIQKFQAAIQESDGLRRNYHNKLIRDIKIATRLININFSIDFPEELRIKAESQIADRAQMSINELKSKLKKREYYKFPFTKGSFIDMSRVPPNSQSEREYIADWALKIYTDLTVLEKEIKK